jgi:hypothetical protein
VTQSYFSGRALDGPVWLCSAPQSPSAVKSEVDKTRRAAAPAQLPQVRKAQSWSRSWANCSLLWLYSDWNAWANLHLLGQPNTFLDTGWGGLVGAAAAGTEAPDGSASDQAIGQFGGDENTVRIWSAVTGECEQTSKGHSSPVNSTTFSQTPVAPPAGWHLRQHSIIGPQVDINHRYYRSY